MNKAVIQTVSGLMLIATLLLSSTAAQADSQGRIVLAQLDLSGKIAVTEGMQTDLQIGIEAFGRGNYRTALKKLKPLAAKQNATAQFCVGKMYMQGLGVKLNYTTAITLLRKASIQGHSEAQAFLGFVNYYGLGVPQNYKEAASWTRKAAEQGVAEAQHNLGWMYEKGQGVAQDSVQAYMWLKLAATSGEEGAIVKMSALESTMTPQEIEAGETLAKQWVAQH